MHKRAHAALEAYLACPFCSPMALFDLDFFTCINPPSDALLYNTARHSESQVSETLSNLDLDPQNLLHAAAHHMQLIAAHNTHHALPSAK